MTRAPYTASELDTLSRWLSLDAGSINPILRPLFGDERRCARVVGHSQPVTKLSPHSAGAPMLADGASIEHLKATTGASITRAEYIAGPPGLRSVVIACEFVENRTTHPGEGCAASVGCAPRIRTAPERRRVRASIVTTPSLARSRARQQRHRASIRDRSFVLFDRRRTADAMNDRSASIHNAALLSPAHEPHAHEERRV